MPLAFRSARFADIPATLWLWKHALEASEYAGRMELDVPLAKRTLEQLVANQRARGEGATCLEVAEHKDKLVGVIAGMVSRVYMVGTALEATDLIWYASDAAPPRTGRELRDRFHAWASKQPVIQIRQTTNQALADSRLTGRIIAGAGLERVGEVFIRRMK